MKLACLVAVLSLSVPVGMEAAQAGRQRGPASAPAVASKVSEAYEQFLLAHRLEQRDDVNGAIAAYKRAIELDPLAADIPATLAGLYLRQNRTQDATSVAEQAIKIAPANREANRVLGMIFAGQAEPSRGNAQRSADNRDENVAKAIKHLEIVVDQPAGEIDPNVRATLGRMYLRAASYEKAISLLTDLINHEPGWPEGPFLLLQAFSGAGRSKEAIAWLEDHAPSDPRLLSAQADYYERDRRWKDAAATYAKAVERAPRNVDLKTRYASALLNAGAPDDLTKARDVLREVVPARANDARVLYLLSQAERRTGDLEAAEATARRVIQAQRGKSPWGYHALAEALEERRDYKAVADALAPAIASMRDEHADADDLAMLLPHVGFAHQELGEHQKAIDAFEEARRLSPKNPAVVAYLVEANLAAKKYAAAIDLAKGALTDHPGDLRLVRLEAQALRQSGKANEGIALLEDLVKQQADNPAAYVALGQIYADASRGPQAVKLLQEAEAKFPGDNSVLFELGAVFDKQKKFADAESTFHRLLARDPDNAPVLNYLGYMLAERGERLDESVGYLKKALQKEPYNGSYLDSLGWAYFKSDKLEVAENNLRRAADQLRANSVIQDHFGDVLFKLGRYDEAIAAWTRALAGDGDSIDRAAIDKKIRSAKQKLGKK